MSTEPQYITRQELDLALKNYERLGASEEYGRILDSQFRSFFTRSIEQSISALQTKFELKLSDLQNDLHTNLKRTQLEIQTAVSNEIASKIAEVKGSLYESILAQASLVVQAKADQISSTVSSHILSHKKSIEALEAAVRTAQDDALKQIADDCKTSSAEISASIVSTALESYSSKIKQSVDNALIQNFELISTKLHEFKDILNRELAEKTIDRDRILKQMHDIELELQMKAQSVIDFQIEQARQMMEQSAKAEMRDGMNSAIALLLGRSNLK